MSAPVQKILFFIKSPGNSTSSIEMFLTKRSFQVHSQTDLKTALLEIMQINPDYIFFATDHPDDRILNLPHIIMQSMMITLIAYCTSNDKIQTRKLQGISQQHKLFPPVSGPAIQRLILKLEKESESQAINPNGLARDSARTDGISNTVHVTSKQNTNDLDQILNSMQDFSAKPTEIYFDKGIRAKQLRSKQKSNDKKSQNNLNSTEESLFTSNSDSDSAAVPIAESASTSNSDTDKTPIAEPKITESLKEQLNTNFSAQVQVPIEEMFETMDEGLIANDASTPPHNENLSTAHFGFCLVIESPQWSGYLIAASEAVIDKAILESILINWINQNFENTSSDQNIVSASFDVDLNKISFEEFSNENAEYSKTILTNNKRTIISLFPLSPDSITPQLHDLHDMIEIFTNEVPADTLNTFDLFLYLPENKKFIRYFKKDTPVTAMQLDRLKEKKVDTLYSTLDFDTNILQLRVKKKLNDLIKNFKNTSKKDDSAI
jgi:hypothetical protein